MCGLAGIWCGTRSATSNSRSFQSRNLVGIVGQQSDSVDAERPQHRRRMPIIALVIGEAEPPVGIDGVEPAVLERIGAELVGEADAAAFLRANRGELRRPPRR